MTVVEYLELGKSKFQSEDNIALNWSNMCEDSAGNRIWHSRGYKEAVRFCVLGAIPSIFEKYISPSELNDRQLAVDCLEDARRYGHYDKGFFTGGFSLAEIHAIYDKAIELAKAES